LTALCLCPWTAQGDGPAGIPSKPANVSDPAELEAFFDGVVNVQLQSKHIAGAVVAVVVGDKVVFKKGYGYADIAARRKVDPDKTLFRIASISKLFTWTAVMQQVDDKKVKLDADINEYLKDIQVPATFPQPITLKDLLTHTPGFEDYVIGLFARQPVKDRSLTDVLKDQMPARVRPPGVLVSYSNHGTALAGAVVESVSGKRWEDYVKEKILDPLEMRHTLTEQPPADQLPPDMSKGYKWDNGEFKEQDFEYVPTAPAGCMSTTAADAARFMLAHLHDGQLDGKRILNAETAQKMRTTLFEPAPGASTMCYGFIEQRYNGLKMVGHGGDTLWFHSLLQLIPEHRVGLFVSYNTDTSGGERDVLLDAFLRRYFPQEMPPRAVPAEGSRERARRCAGEYGITRYSHSSLTKLMALFGVFKVGVNDDDTLSIKIRDTSYRLVEVEPLVYREQDGPRKIVFKEDRDGRVTSLVLADVPVVCAVRRAWYERSELHWGVLAASVGVFASALLFWPALAFTVRGLQSPTIRRTRFSGVLSCLAWLFSGLGVAFVAGMAIILSDPNEIVFGLTPAVKALGVLAPVCAALAGVTVVACLVAWMKGYWRLSGRLHYTLVALAGLGFTWFLYYWNVLSFGWSQIL
jgi:CubicO group peptidase (beta-lactamase class C family)